MKSFILALTAYSAAAIQLQSTQVDNEFLSKASVIDENKQHIGKDDVSEIHCYIDDLATADSTWPQDNCCRFYSEVDARGKYVDFCNDSDERTKTYTFKSFHSRATWVDRTKSYRCGAKAAADALNRLDDLEIQLHSVGPNATNYDVQVHGEIDKIRIWHSEYYNGPTHNAIFNTIFSDKGCKGLSAATHAHEKESANHCEIGGTIFTRTFNQVVQDQPRIIGWREGELGSIHLNPFTAFQSYFDKQLDGPDSYTHKYFGPNDRGTCINMTSETGGLPSDRFNVDANIGDWVDSGVRSYQYRQVIFPSTI